MSLISFAPSLNRVKRHHPFLLNAMVVLPDHLHLLMTLPENDDDFATRLMLIKAGFSRQITNNEKISQSRKLVGWAGTGSPTNIKANHVGLRSSAQPTKDNGNNHNNYRNSDAV